MEALSKLVNAVELFCAASGNRSEGSKLSDFYGIETPAFTVNAFTFYFSMALNLQIGLFAFFKIIWARPKNIISRNLYFSFFAASIGLRQVFETHKPEKGFRFYMQKYIIARPETETVVISNALKTLILDQTGLSKPIHVLPDAAPYIPLKKSKKKESVRIKVAQDFKLRNSKPLITYVGHLYEGRGIEIISELSILNSSCDFVVVGGNDDDIERWKSKVNVKNLHFLGHLSHARALEVMQLADVLLLPYQKSVSIGVRGSNTSAWMSPIKMFEYMSSGVPIVASDLPVLREVLSHMENSILVRPEDINGWNEAIRLLLKNKKLAHAIGNSARDDYRKNYTWDIRAERLLSLMQ